MSVPAKQIDGDVLVGRNITAGGDATVRGSATVDHDVTVKGWLYAPNIKSEIITGITADITKIYGLLKGLDSALDEAALAQYLIKNKYVTQSWVNDILKGYLTKQIADGLYQPKGDYPTYDLSIYLTKTEAASTYLEKSVFDELLEKVNIGTDANPVWAIRAKYGLYTNDFLAGKGRGVSSGGDSGDGSLFGLMREWPTADPGSTTDDALGANLGWELHNKIAALEAKNFLDALDLTVTGSGNAVTNVALSADHKTLTLTKDTTFLTQHQSLANYLTKSEAASTYLTAITKQMVEDVLTGNITSHTHSQYLTSHQAIYALTFAAGSFSAKTYNPKSAATTVNIPTTTSHIAEGANKYYTDARAIAALKPTTDALDTAITDFRTLFDSMFERESDGKGGYVIHAKYGLYTNDFLAGKGTSGAPSGTGGGSLFGLYTDTTWVSVPAESDALSAVLGKSLHARVSVLEGAGYLTGITKAMVEAVLTGDITTHTHSLLSKPADNRSVATAPNDYNGKFFFTGMKRRDALSAPGSDTYVNGFGWRGWSDSSGGKAWEVFGDNADLYVRCGATTTWEAWRKILTDGNYASTLDDHYVTRGTAQEITAKKTFTGHLGLGIVSDNWNVARATNTLSWLHSGGTAAQNAPGTYYSGVSFMTSYVGFQLATYGTTAETLMFRKIADNDTWSAWRSILHTGNYASVLDSRYIRPTGTDAQFLMADGSVTTKATANNITTLGWTAVNADALRIPDINMIAYWNGCYRGTSSNLQYCDRGRFGTMAVANAADYVTVATAQNISGVKTFTGGLHLKMGNNFANSYNDGLRIHVCGTQQWASLLFCGADNTGDAGTSANSWGLFMHDGAFGIGRNGNGIASGTSRLWCDADNTWNISGLLKIGSLNVSSNALVTNLNAELLGGLTCDQVRSSVMRFLGRQPSSTTNVDLDQMTYGMARNYWGFNKWTNAPAGMRYGAAITFSQYQYDNLYGQLAWDVNHYTADVTGNLFWRAFATASDGTNKWGGWKQIAFTDGTIANATNADKLDGKHGLEYQRDLYTYHNTQGFADTTVNPNILSSATGLSGFRYFDTKFYNIVSPTASRFQIAYPYADAGTISYRTYYNSAWSAWQHLARTTDNVASATKLQTARSIWGQNFDGTSAITGNMIHVGEFRFEAGTAILHNATTKVYQLWAVNGINLFPTWSVNTAVLSVTPNGNVGRVGVNMFSPAYDFDVTGVIHASGEIFSDKAIGGKGMTSSSDIRQKHIVGNVELSFEAILNSPSKRFTWLGDATKTERIGTIAQYWLKRLPQVVYTAPDGYYAVDYGTLANAKADTIAHVVADLVERLNKLESQLNTQA